ncbi:MAG: DUF4974 domain-containing protein [Acidobacteriota bacterium]
MICIRTVAAAALVVGLLVPVLAQDALSKRVTLDLKAVEPTSAFNTLAEAMGLKVTVDRAVTAPIDILVRNVKARTALDAMCDSIGCRWSVQKGALSVMPATTDVVAGRRTITYEEIREPIARVQIALRKDIPAGLVFTNAPLSEVCVRLSEALGVTITIDSDVLKSRTVTADLSHHTLQSALKLLLDQVGGGKTFMTFRASRTGEHGVRIGVTTVVIKSPPRVEKKK